MNNNQTIDGVSRELVCMTIDLLQDLRRGTAIERRLRALQDAPACSACNDTGRMHEPGCEPGACTACLEKPAAQPQPVARVEIGADRNAALTVTDDDWLRSLKDRGVHQIVSLYAEQPAPVAMTQPIAGLVDLRLLLNKYIEHVGQCEGTDFIKNIGDNHGGSDVTFSAEELSELVSLREYPLAPADGAVPTLLTASVCKTCLGQNRIIQRQEGYGVLVGPCPSCNPAPVAVVLPARPRADEEEYERMTDYEKGLLHGGIELWDKIDEAIRLSAKSR